MSAVVGDDRRSLADDCYELFAIRYGTNPRRRRVENLIWIAPDDPHDAAMPMDFFVWVAVGAKRVILIDTGSDRQTCSARGHDFIRDPVDGLALLGLEPRDVDEIVTTHLHWDHSGNLGHFLDKRLHVQRAEVVHASGPCMTRAFLRRPYDLAQFAEYLKAIYAGRVTFHSGDAELVPGLSIHLVGGHTPGMQVVCVNTRRGRVVLASDAVHFYENLHAENPFPVLVNTIDYVEALHTVRALAPTTHHVVPGHDPLVLVQYPPVTAAAKGIVVRLDVDPLEADSSIGSGETERVLA